MMTENNPENHALITARQLLEIISPDGDIFEQSCAHFEENYSEVLANDLSLLWALYEAGKGKSIFVGSVEDGEEIIFQLKQIASYWQADIFLSDLDDYEDYVFYENSPTEILARAAIELRSYGLILWQWENENIDICFGFISREEDQDLIERCGQKLTENFHLLGEDF